MNSISDGHSCSLLDQKARRYFRRNVETLFGNRVLREWTLRNKGCTYLHQVQEGHLSSHGSLILAQTFQKWTFRQNKLKKTVFLRVRTVKFLTSAPQFKWRSKRVSFCEFSFRLLPKRTLEFTKKSDQFMALFAASEERSFWVLNLWKGFKSDL